MANQTIVFDPTAGVPVGANLTIYGGSELAADFSVVDTGSVAYDLTAVGATLGVKGTFTVGFTSAADGKIRVSYGATQTGELSAGRYMYNVLISTGTTVYNLIDGNIMVYAGISSSPGSA